jgi:hypothetical protein
MEVIDTVTGDMPRLKILSAVSNIDHEKLVHIVNDTISEKLTDKMISFKHNRSHEHGHPTPINLVNNN